MIGIGATLFKVPTMHGGAAFSPASLFSDGEEGFWYDPSDLSTLFKDDGTTPAVVDDVVGKVLDKSGNGNNLIQATSTKCPILRQSGSLYYLEFDGIDDNLRTENTIDFSGGDQMTICTGATKDVDGTMVIVEHTANIGSNNGTFRMAAISGDVWRYTSKGTVISNSTANNYTAPTTNVLTGLSDISADSAIIRVDGVQKNESTSNQGDGNYTNDRLNVGSRNTGFGLQLDGRIYGLLGRALVSSTVETVSLESYMAAKTGVSI